MRQRKIITKDNIYIVQQFAYVHKAAEISLFTGKKNTRSGLGQQAQATAPWTKPQKKSIKIYSTFILGQIIIWTKYNQTPQNPTLLIVVPNQPSG